MKIEDKLSRTLKDALHGEPLPKGVWEAFERRARRAQRVRVVIGSTLAAAAVLAAIVIVPKVVTGDRSVPPAGEARFDLNSGPVPGWLTHRNAAGDFIFRYPLDWVLKSDGTSGFLHPPGLTGRTESDFAFVVNFTLLDQPLDESPGRRNVAGFPEGVVSKSGSVNGHRYYANLFPDMNQYEIAWTKDRTLIMTLQSYVRGPFTSGVEAFKHYSVTGERIISTLVECGCNDPATAGWVTYRSPSKGFSLLHPKNWKETGFEGGEEFDAPGQTSLARGEATFAIEVLQQAGQYYEPQPGDQAPVTTTRGVIGGRRYVRYEYHNGQQTQFLYRIDWTGVAPCPPPGSTCSHSSPLAQTLQVSVIGSTASLWERYNRTAVLMVESIRESR